MVGSSSGSCTRSSSGSCSASSSADSTSGDKTGVGSFLLCAGCLPFLRFAEGSRVSTGSGESSSRESSASADSCALSLVFLGLPLGLAGVDRRSSSSSATTRLGVPRLADTGEIHLSGCLVRGGDDRRVLGASGVGSDSTLASCAGDESSSISSSSCVTTSVIDSSPMTLGVTLAGAGVSSSSSSTTEAMFGVAGTRDRDDDFLERLLESTVGVSGGASVDLDLRDDSRVTLCDFSREELAGAGVSSRPNAAWMSMASSSGSSGSSSTSSRTGDTVATTLRSLSTEFVSLF